jgi:GNAT superfamily N-acetyltransferase
MLGEIAQSSVDPAAADEDFWRRYHELRRLKHSEVRPDDPAIPDEAEERLMKRLDPFHIVHRYETSRRGEMLSWLHSEVVKPGTPEYDSNKQFLEADLYVRPDHRRQGIGASSLPLLVELMDRHNCTILNLYSELDSGHAFLKWLGAESKAREIENRLRLVDVDWSMVERWAEEGVARSPRTKLEIYDGPLPESMWDEFARQYTILINTIPFEDLDHGDIVITPSQMREWYARQEMTGVREQTVLTREPDGSISGITDVDRASYRPTIVHQQLTAVHPEARGRGLGKWIKAAMLLHLRELYPEAQWIVTENAGSNEPMLAINTKLGFKQYRVGVAYQISREKLEARVKALA